MPDDNLTSSSDADSALIKLQELEIKKHKAEAQLQEVYAEIDELELEMLKQGQPMVACW